MPGAWSSTDPDGLHKQPLLVPALWGGLGPRRSHAVQPPRCAVDTSHPTGRGPLARLSLGTIASLSAGYQPPKPVAGSSAPPSGDVTDTVSSAAMRGLRDASSAQSGIPAPGDAFLKRPAIEVLLIRGVQRHHPIGHNDDGGVPRPRPGSDPATVPSTSWRRVLRPNGLARNGMPSRSGTLLPALMAMRGKRGSCWRRRVSTVTPSNPGRSTSTMTRSRPTQLPAPSHSSFWVHASPSSQVTPAFFGYSAPSIRAFARPPEVTPR